MDFTQPASRMLSIDAARSPDFLHSPDFAMVRWHGQTYSLTPRQRVVVAELWNAWENGLPCLTAAYLLERCGTAQAKMSAVFRNSPAWKTLIVPGQLHGGPEDSYCLAPTPPLASD